ncbi:MAG: hypothetical protein RSE00_03895 [Clostridia bacterium]
MKIEKKNENVTTIVEEGSKDQYKRVNTVPRFNITDSVFGYLNSFCSDTILVPAKIMDRFCIEVIVKANLQEKREIYISYLGDSVMCTYYSNKRLAFKMVSSEENFKESVGITFYNEYQYLSKKQQDEYILSIMRIWDVVTTFFIKYKNMLVEENVKIKGLKNKKYKNIKIYNFPTCDELIKKNKKLKINLDHSEFVFVSGFTRIVKGEKQKVKGHFKQPKQKNYIK